MKYLKSKPGSLEAAAGQVSGFATEQEYQKMFKKELDKAGKGIASMSDQEKKNFFNKIDKMYKAKNEITAAQKKLPPALQKAIKDKEQKEELNKDDKSVVKKVKDMLKGASAKHAAQAKMLDKAMKSEGLDDKDTKAVKDVVKGLKGAVAAHGQQVKKLDKALKSEADTKGNEINKSKLDRVKKGEKDLVDPKPSLKSVAKTVKEMMRKKKDDVATMADTEKEKEKKTTLVGSKKTPVDLKPEVEYKN